MNKHIELPALSDDEIDDLSWSEFESAVAMGISVDSFKRLAKTVRNRMAAAIAAYEEARVVGEPVAWQFRWTNPGNNPNTREDETAWKPLEPRGSETMQQRVAEIEHYEYEGKPCYEVRALVAAPVAQPATEQAEAPSDDALMRQAMDALDRLTKESMASMTDETMATDESVSAWNDACLSIARLKTRLSIPNTQGLPL